MSLYSEYVEKKVVLIYNEPGNPNTLEVEGTILSANDSLVMFKPKGKTQAVLINVSDIERVDYAQEKEKDIKAKPLKIVVYGQARAHLADRHGISLAEVNKLSEKVAFDYHASIDHIQADLGHYHEDKNVTDRAPESKDE